MTAKADKITTRKERDRQIATLQRDIEVEAAGALDVIAAAFTGSTTISEALAVLSDNVPLLTMDTQQHQFASVLQNIANAGDVATVSAKAIRDRHAQADAVTQPT